MNDEWERNISNSNRWWRWNRIEEAQTTMYQLWCGGWVSVDKGMSPSSPEGWGDGVNERSLLMNDIGKLCEVSKT